MVFIMMQVGNQWVSRVAQNYKKGLQLKNDELGEFLGHPGSLKSIFCSILWGPLSYPSQIRHIEFLRDGAVKQISQFLHERSAFGWSTGNDFSG